MKKVKIAQNVNLDPSPDFDALMEGERGKGFLEASYGIWPDLRNV